MGKGAGLTSHCLMEETGLLKRQCGNRDSKFLTMFTHHCCCLFEQKYQSLHFPEFPNIFSALQQAPTAECKPLLPLKAVSELHCPFPCYLLLKCT